MSLPPEFKYQEFIRKKIVLLKRTGVLAVPGSGKTRPIIDALVEMSRIYPEADSFDYRYPYGPILIVCSGPAIATWQRQLPEWTDSSEVGEDIVTIRGGQKGLDRRRRTLMWHAAAAGCGGIFITNGSILLRDIRMIEQVEWAAVVVDEYHKFMRRKRRNKTYAAFIHMTRHTPIVIMASGSAIRKDPSSMFTLFQALYPKKFTSYWKYVNTWCIVSDGHFGKEILGPRNVDKFRELMDRHLAYVPEEVIADQLPKGRRMPMLAEMTKKQGKIYHELADEMLTILESGEIIVTPNVLTKIIRLRQLLCCPRILDATLDMGGGFQVIVDALEVESHAVIFVPFRPACDFIMHELQQLGYKHVYMIRGGITPEQQTWDINGFKEHQGILICTIAYAESFDLETCKTSYFLGYDYSLDVNEQAEGRTRRVISEHEFVTWNYIKYLRTIDEGFLRELDTDARNVHRILHRPAELIALLKGE